MSQWYPVRPDRTPRPLAEVEAMMAKTVEPSATFLNGLRRYLNVAKLTSQEFERIAVYINNNSADR